jgi:hypothetical protein
VLAEVRGALLDDGCVLAPVEPPEPGRGVAEVPADAEGELVVAVPGLADDAADADVVGAAVVPASLGDALSPEEDEQAESRARARSGTARRIPPSCPCRSADSRAGDEPRQFGA